MGLASSASRAVQPADVHEEEFQHAQRVAGIMCLASYTAVDRDSVSDQGCVLATFADEKAVQEEVSCPYVADSWRELVSAESDSLREAEKTMISERDKE